MIKTLIVLMLLQLLGCSSSVKTMFEEKEAYDPLDNIEINESIAKKFKTKETPKIKKKATSKKKVVKAKRKPKKIKKEMIPKEFREKFLALDKNSKKVWDQFDQTIKNEEEIVIKVYFFGLTVGHLKMSVKPLVKVGDRQAYHFAARMKSAKYYSYFYSLDNSIDSYLDYQTLKPLKYSALQRESKQKVDDVQLFDMEKRKTFAWYKRVKKDKDKEFTREAYTPEYFMDFYSAFYFTRGLPMISGNIYTIPVVSRGKIYRFIMEVMGQENVKVNRRSYPAYKIKGNSINENNEKKGEAFFWYSIDSSRKLLKFSAKVKIGEIRGELVDYKVGDSLTRLDALSKKL